ncbi:crossover junction endodeoxyribonuclease RuvC [Cytobacillus massiliigabonensis]|uniref:crossover junction endodeoxyribonuclease RuvC n=1 Tax=Cytobacillus massiliigabonensis TaxID=1871011 RepID=UPI000C83479F|nr:crossover junction endodeoxyribonuclease RuvC [Cytobacillus massiliigabonensis]
MNGDMNQNDIPTIMGIDASLTNSGIAITTFNKKIIILQTIKTTSNTPVKERILFVHQELERLIEEFNVRLVLIENNYTGGSKEVNWIIGVIYLITAKRGLEIKTYPPSTIKKVVTGNGRANKKEIKPSINKIFGELRTNEHIRDALAIIHCYFLKENDKNVDKLC